MEISRPSRSIHKSIIREVKSIDSWESGLLNLKYIKAIEKSLFFSQDCISIDDNNHHNSSTLLINTDVPTCSQDNIIPTNICCNKNNTSIDNIHQRSGSISSQSSRTRGNY